MRGEYKVPGGKMVAADVEVADGRIASAVVQGDFFLEPDEALEDINAALVGLPETTSATGLGYAIEAALPEGVEMIGFTPAAVGIAVRRALGHATSWADHTFDLIGPVTMDPAMHVALDEVLTKEVAAGRRRPTLRFWDWDSALVVMGSFQSYVNEIDQEGADRHGIRVETTPTFWERFEDAFLRETIHFVDCVRHDREPGLSLHDATEATRIAIALRTSLVERREVDL